MAISRKTNVPNAPLRVGFWTELKLNRIGRVDARKYLNFQDTTATHAINKLEAQMKTGQLKVNAWLANEMQPLRAGNQALGSQIAHLDQRIAKIEANLGPTGRIRKANTGRLQQLRQQRLNALAQKSTNNAAARAFVEVAFEGNQTWRRFYEAQAAMYVRARSLKTKGKLAAANSSIPSVTDVRLLDIEDFFDDDTPTEKGSK